MTRGVNASGFFCDCAASAFMCINDVSANTAAMLTAAPPAAASGCPRISSRTTMSSTLNSAPPPIYETQCRIPRAFSQRM